MYINKILLCALISLNISQKDQKQRKILKTTYGLISGTINKTGEVWTFKGVPFAAPPVGDLRWREPQPIKAWKGIRKCDEFGPNAMQAKPIPSGPYGPEILIPANEKISEDCLYLNVWAPARQSGGKRPVVVIVHGGGFTAGSGSISLLNGEELAKKGAVVVTINYRLGIFGFLAHPELTRESPHHTSGNYGILDQIAAFKWIKENIAVFGGDPNNITADGGSAGSCSVLTIVASPLGEGLFKRVISESGPLFKPGECRTLPQAEQEGLETMNKKGATSLTEMRNVPADFLLKDDHLRLPVVDNYLLTDHILDIFTNGKQNGVDLLIGYNEGDYDFGTPIAKARTFVQDAQQKYGDKATAFLQLYPAKTDEQAAQSQIRLSRDRVFAWGNYIWARQQSANGKQKVWYYYFSHPAPGNPDYGAFHGCQGVYALKNLDRWNKPLREWDRTLSNIMSEYWINFAATGNPNGKGLPEWPVFTQSDTRLIEFGTSVRIIDLPAMRSFDFF